MKNKGRNLEFIEASLSIPLNELKRYNVKSENKRTSVTLEPKIWEILKEICEDENVSVNELATMLKKRQSENSSLSSGIRVFLISYLFAKLKYLEGKKK